MLAFSLVSKAVRNWSKIIMPHRTVKDVLLNHNPLLQCLGLSFLLKQLPLIHQSNKCHQSNHLFLPLVVSQIECNQLNSDAQR